MSNVVRKNEMPSNLELSSYAMGRLGLDYVPSIQEVIIRLRDKGYKLDNYCTSADIYAILKYL